MQPVKSSLFSQMRKVAVVFGASRGIGRDICLKLAEEYIVVALSKTTRGSKNANIGNIDDLVETININGGKADGIECNVMDLNSIDNAIQSVLDLYQRIDLVVYNAGAIDWNQVKNTPIKKYDLMHSINTRGLYYVIQVLLPIFERQKEGNIVAVSPPIYSRFLKGKTPYAMTKLAATILVLGLAMELPDYIKINALWPATAIKSHVTTVKNVDDNLLRSPRIFSDAIVAIVKSGCSGRCLIDEDFLREIGVDDFSKYRCGSTEPPRMMPKEFPDLRVKEQDAVLAKL